MPICDAAGRAPLGAGVYTGAARTHREERYWQRAWRIYKTRPQDMGSKEATLGRRIPRQRKESSSRPPSAGRPGAASSASVFKKKVKIVGYFYPEANLLDNGNKYFPG